jgi:hypothetical protein
MMLYISGPLSTNKNGLQKDHVAKAVQLYLDLTREGISAYCPHLSALAQGAMDVPYERWMEVDFEFVKKADVVLMLEGWTDSHGACLEHDLARTLKKRIIYNVEELTS